MMERFGSQADRKNEVPSHEGEELSASQLADAMKEVRNGREEFRGGEINPEELRAALARAMKDPISL